MAYIGIQPELSRQVLAQSFNGDGSQTNFTLNNSVSNNKDIEVLVDNVQQSPYDGSYSVSGTTLTFSEAPSSGTNNIYVIHRSSTIVSNQIIPDDGSVTSSKLTGNITTPANLTVTGDSVLNGTATINGGNNSVGLFLRNGADIRFYNANNTGSADLYCDTNGELKTLNSITAAGGFKLGSELKTSWGKSKKQKVQNSVDGLTINSGSWTTIVSVSITVSAGSDVFVMFNGEQNAENGAAWQWVALFRDNTQLGTTTIEVNQQSWNSNFHPHWWDENLPAGTYTYSCKAYNGSNWCTWGEHSEPTIQAIEFGV